MQIDASLWGRVEPAHREVAAKFMQEAPVKIGSLAIALGLEVKVVALEPNISGEIRPSDTAEAGYKIRVNRHEMKPRQRYTIAHELAHYMLHRHLIGTGISDSVLYRSTQSDQIEREANRLAADLLMPRDLVRTRLEALGGRVDLGAAEELAEEFEVSLPAMKIRLGIG